MNQNQISHFKTKSGIAFARFAGFLFISFFLTLQVVCAQTVVISEILASNATGITTFQGKHEDWIELHNTANETINLGGWFLTDSKADLTKYQIPNTFELPAGGYKIIFADGATETSYHSGEYHANFSLSKDGEYLALVRPDGVSIEHEYNPYPQMRTDISYGISEGSYHEEVISDSASGTYSFTDADGQSHTGTFSGPVGFKNDAEYFQVTCYNSSSEITSLNDAKSVIETPERWATEPVTQSYQTINFKSTKECGNFPADNLFPGVNVESAQKNFVLKIERIFSVESAGVKTFAVSSGGAYNLLVQGEGLEFTLEQTSVEDMSTNASLKRMNFKTVGTYTFTQIFYYSGSGEPGLEVSISEKSRYSFLAGEFGLFGEESSVAQINQLIKTEISELKGVTDTVNFVYSFVIPDHEASSLSLQLEARYADAFIAKLNNVEVLNVNPEKTARTALESIKWEKFDIDATNLKKGYNILEIKLLNDSISDGLFFLSPRLTYSAVALSNFYYAKPTPNAANGTGSMKMLGNVTFSESRGYKDEPFELALQSDDPDCSIYYTLDGTIPTAQSRLYSKPLKISDITTIRAFAKKTGCISSPVATRTWLFVEKVLTQSTSTPSGWPSSYSVNNHKMEYGMNQSIANDPRYKEDIRTGLTNIASFSIVTDLENLFNAQTGIYVNPSQEGENWERPISLELIDPSGGEEFQIDAGIRLRGNASRNSSNPKHSFRFFFNSKYGGNLKFPLFQEEGATEFDKVDLRTSQNHSWASEYSSSETFIRETFARDSQRDVGMPYTRSRYYHLYINGQYWGLYQTQERSETSYAETYLGGNKEDWDLLKTDRARNAAITEGTTDAFYQFYKIAIREGFAGNYETNYWRIRGLNLDGTENPDLPTYLDEENLLEFAVNYYFTADPDSPFAVWGDFANNYYGLYNRENPTGFKWFRHDAEHSLGARRSLGYSESFNITSYGWNFNNLNQFNPIRVHQKLMDHPDYRIKFADRIQKQVLNPGGAFSLDVAVERWNMRALEIYNPIVVESARWGHGYTRESWLSECNYATNQFFVNRPTYMMNEIKSYGWFPTISTPQFSRSTGVAPKVSPVTVKGMGAIYYTIDGSDPRLSGGKINPNAIRLNKTNDVGSVLIPAGSSWKYNDEGGLPPIVSKLSWNAVKYRDWGWYEGNAGFGFGTAVNTLLNKEIDDELVNTAYFRKNFTIESSLESGVFDLKLNCMDGAVIYLNGAEFTRVNMPPESQYSTYALKKIEKSPGNNWGSYKFNVSNIAAGEYVMAVEIHRSSKNSEPLYFDMDLTLSEKIDDDEQIYILDNVGNEFVKARCYTGTEWSTLAEADYTNLGNLSSLRVSEMMYSAEIPFDGTEFTRDDFAWIELKNVGDKTIDLSGVQFLEGISYTFPEFKLKPGEYVVVAKNLEAFKALYGEEIVPIGVYSGNLARKGETITLIGPDGTVIQSFTYSNKWYPETDKTGYSLVVKDLNADLEAWSTPENWVPSAVKYGSPGKDQPIVDIPKITNLAFDGQVLSFDVETTASQFTVWASENLKDWVEFTDYELEGKTVIIDVLTLEEKKLFFRIGL